MLMMMQFCGDICPTKKLFSLNVGIIGTLLTLGYGAYAYRFRGPMSTSSYLTQLRVVSQSAVVGSMIVGALITSITSSKKKED